MKNQFNPISCPRARECLWGSSTDWCHIYNPVAALNQAAALGISDSPEAQALTAGVEDLIEAQKKCAGNLTNQYVIQTEPFEGAGLAPDEIARLAVDIKHAALFTPLSNLAMKISQTKLY